MCFSPIFCPFTPSSQAGPLELEGHNGSPHSFPRLIPSPSILFLPRNSLVIHLSCKSYALPSHWVTYQTTTEPLSRLVLAGAGSLARSSKSYLVTPCRHSPMGLFLSPCYCFNFDISSSTAPRRHQIGVSRCLSLFPLLVSFWSMLPIP